MATSRERSGTALRSTTLHQVRKTGPLIRLFRPGGVLNIAVAVLAGGTVVTTAALMAPRTPSASLSTLAYSQRPAAPLTAQELAVGLTRVGLDAASLTAAGVSDAHVTTVVADARTYLIDHVQSLRDADALVGTTRKERDRLERLIQSGQASPSDLNAFETARTDYTSAVVARQAILDALFTAATASIMGVGGEGSGALSTISNLKTNRDAGWEVPTQYLAINSFGQADWVTLRDSLAADRIAAGYGEDPDPTAHQFVVAANGLGPVSGASTNLTNNLAVNTAAWNAAVGQ